MELHYCFLPLPLLLLLLLSPCVSAAAQDDSGYVNCSKPFRCGGIEAEYPFWGGSRAEFCGRPGFKLECESDETTITPESSPKFRILELKPGERRMRVATVDFFKNTCLLQIPHTDMKNTTFKFATRDLTLYYNCTNSFQQSTPPSLKVLDCSIYGEDVNLIFTSSSPEGPKPTCFSNFTIPIPEAIYFSKSTSLRGALKEEFEVEWGDDDLEDECKKCTDSGGECGFDQASKKFACFCADQSYSDPRLCSRGKVSQRIFMPIPSHQVGYLVVSMLFPLAVLLMWSNAWLNRQLERNVTDKGGCFQQVSSEQNSPQSRPAVVETVQVISRNKTTLVMCWDWEDKIDLKHSNNLLITKLQEELIQNELWYTFSPRRSNVTSRED